MAKKEEPKKEDVEEKDAKDDKKDKKKEDDKGEAKEGEEGAPKEGEEGAAPKKSKKKIIIVGVLALVLLLGGGGGAYFVLRKHDAAPAGEAGADKNAEKPVFYTLPEFLVNLNTGGKQVSYLKTTIILEVSHQADVPFIETSLPRLFDTLNTYLRELRASDLAGSAGIQRLREELLVRSNKVLWPIKVNDILFKEIVVQ